MTGTGSRGNSNPEPLGDALEALMRHLGAPPVRIVASIEERWPDIVGPTVAAHTRPAEVTHGELTVLCDEPAWASQLQWMEQQICRQCFEELDGLEVQRVRVRVVRP